ncbi:MAG: hypothetical protein QCI82_02265, partial [Candidatus Thermoplasmatota archaeon]|nr:hypothetical protein [Candidatus Thermoplasmatota archaeon]
ALLPVMATDQRSNISFRSNQYPAIRITMLLRNRSLLRNRILYGIVLTAWISLFAFPLLIFQVRRVPFIALEVLLLSLLVTFTLRHFLKMPRALEITDALLIVHLPHRSIDIDPEGILDIRYDRKDRKLRIVSADSIHRFGDLRLDPEDEEALKGIMPFRRPLGGRRGYSRMTKKF